MSAGAGGAPFLTAEWRDLAMLNWTVDATAVAPHVPPGTEADPWRGETWLSLVGFRFLRTPVRRLSIPGHQDFEEVNVRTYVRRRGPEGWRRGVVFLRELVPRRAIATVARLVYGEPYRRTPMGHEVRRATDAAGAERVLSATYRWGTPEAACSMSLGTSAEPAALAEGSHAAFIAEHYWGYSPGRRGRTLEYRVEHPPWRAQDAREARVEGQLGAHYDPWLAKTLARPPDSAFLAEGSAVAVYPGVRIDTT